LKIRFCPDSRRQLDEVHLEALGQERVVAGTDPPPGAGLCGVAGVAHLGVVHHHGVVADPGRGELAAAELLEAVRL
jgi:hypothetical protein